MSISDGETERRLWSFSNFDADVAPSEIQLVGTLFFNTSTFAALAKNLSVEQINLLVCAPDVFGSIAFLLSSVIASWAVRVRGAARARDWWIAAVNLFGSIAFGVSALGAVFLPSPREMLDVSRVNIATFVGAVLFFIGAVLTVPTSD